MTSIERFIKTKEPINREYYILPTEGGYYTFFSKNTKRYQSFVFKGIKKLNTNVYMIKSIDNLIIILGYDEETKEIKALYECRKILYVYDDMMVVENFYGIKKILIYSPLECKDFNTDTEDERYLFFNNLEGGTDILDKETKKKIGSFEYIHTLDDYNLIGRKPNGKYVYICLKEFKISREYSAMYHFMFGENGMFIVEDENERSALLNSKTMEVSRFFDNVVRLNSEFAVCFIGEKQVIVRFSDLSEAHFS